jgi:asparagine synthase (glutamine-hydrolysing)
MCGISGVFDPRQKHDPANRAAMNSAMRTALAHRGPDGSGEFQDEAAGIHLGHQRLAIVDLDETGAQPMESSSGRFVLVYNGEIYNRKALRADLEGRGVFFRGHSDTEVFLAAIDEYGLDEALHQAQGMFGFALWDRKDHALTLARDATGQKPLYLMRLPGGAWAFASEMGAFFALEQSVLSLSARGVRLLLRYGFIPAPDTIFDEVTKVRAGHLIRLTADTSTPKSRLHPALDVQRHFCPDKNLVHTDENTALDAFQHTLNEVVGEHGDADVPVGTMLSGGVDSALVTAALARNTPNPVRTFTVSIQGAEGDEGPLARAVAQHLGTRHTELDLTLADLRAAVESMPGIYSEPFADASQLPTALICRLARQEVKVMLSGDGGDEIFGGYHRYRWGRRLMAARHILPRPIKDQAWRALLAARRTLPHSPSRKARLFRLARAAE